MEQLTLIPACTTDIPLIMQFIAEAQQHLKEQGIDQWQDGYPNQEGIASDIAAHKGYLVICSASPAPIAPCAEKIGYLCIDFEGEPAYDIITEGSWNTGNPYAVVHRFTIGDAHKGKGLANAIFALVDDFCATHGIRNFRIDTHPDNLKMQHVLKKHGFALCGTVVYVGGDRLAYDKIIT